MEASISPLSQNTYMSISSKVSPISLELFRMFAMRTCMVSDRLLAVTCVRKPGYMFLVPENIVLLNNGLRSSGGFVNASDSREGVSWGRA